MSISSVSNQNIYTSYQSLASGKRINSAADDAAGLAIAQKLQSQANGYDVGYCNAATSKDVLNIADGALGSITDNLQRIRELSVQASNGLYTESDRGMIQMEIDQLKQSIADTASQTQFNTKNLLDGSLNDFHVASDANGSGMTFDMPNATLQALGIADFDVTSGNFDISVIDDALDKVSSSRGSVGATSNRLDHMMAYNANASYNTVASQSRIEDLDYAKGISDMKKQNLLNTYNVMMMRKKLEDENGRVMQLLRS